MLFQLLANGIISGCGYALVALGFSMVYFTTKTFHFAHGSIYTLSVYLFFTFYNVMKFPLPIAIILSLTLIAIIGILVDELVYVPLVKKNSSSSIQMLSSLGLYIVIVNFIAMIYGNETKVLSPGIQPTYQISSVILTRIQILNFITSVILSTIFLLFLKFAKLGIMIRGMRDNPDLLSVMGISPRKIRWFVFSIGSVFAGVASILNGLDVGIDPNIGMSALLNGAVAVVIGGVGIFEGSFLGAILLGSLQSLVIWKASARWQDTITFILLIILLLIRPQGILGSKRRVEEVLR
jgi:branched-chain amino acid transport system permease protein